MEAGKRTIEQLFNKGRVLEIPFFQRSYVWEEDNWERFLADMENLSSANRDYFMGSVILKGQSVPSNSEIGDCRVVVDGQQRLTTIILFFKELYKVKGDQKSFTETFYNRNREVILKHNHNDIEIFEAIIEDKLTDQIEKKYENNNLLKCFLYFRRNADIFGSINTHSILNHLYFVGIDLGAGEDEQQIFDTINSLGVSLTTAELLKNELFKRDDELLYKNTWKSAFEKDEDTRGFWDQKITAGRQHRVSIDLLLQSYLLIKSDARTEYLGLESLFRNYKKFLEESDVDKKHFIEDLISYATLYQNNIDIDYLNQDIDRDSPIERLNVVVFGLNTTTIIPYILYVLKEVADREERRRIFRLIESYLMRRLICKETTKNYNNFFASLIRNKTKTCDLLKERIYKSEDQINRFPGDDDLWIGFQNSNLTNQQSKTVLYLIEKSIRQSQYSTNLRSLNEYSLEHIMPKKWRNNWGNNLNEEQSRQRDQLLLKLGNLTIITSSLNSSIRDADWETKKNGNGNKKGLNTYSTGVQIFQEYLKEPIWNEEKIQERNKELFEHAKNIWKEI